VAHKQGMVEWSKRVSDGGSTGASEVALDEVYGVYGGGVGAIQYGEIEAEIVAEQDQTHHLSQRASSRGVHHLPANSCPGEDFSGGLIAKDVPGVKRRGRQQDYEDLLLSPGREIVAHRGVVVKFGEELAESPGLAVLVELGLPPESYSR